MKACSGRCIIMKASGRYYIQCMYFKVHGGACEPLVRETCWLRFLCIVGTVTWAKVMEKPNGQSKGCG